MDLAGFARLAGLAAAVGLTGSGCFENLVVLRGLTGVARSGNSGKSIEFGGCLEASGSNLLFEVWRF